MIEDDIKVIDFLHERDFFPDDNGAWMRIKTYLAEALKPSHNNRSDEIAIQLQNAVGFIPVDCASNIREARAIVMDCIAQLRA
jgi:hypothetical protein